MNGSGGRPRTRFVTKGQRFGRLTVINPEVRKPRKSNPARSDWAAECQCDCGNTTVVVLDALLRESNSTTSCGCGIHDGLARHPRGEVPAMLRDWTGSPEQIATSTQAITDWNATPEGQAELARKQQSPARKAAAADAQRRPAVRARQAARMRTHGMSRHPLYGTWNAMMTRCYDSKHPSFRRYGARGITVYEPWHDPRVFITWVETNLGPRPAGMSIDRWPDNNGNYEPGNVRWATPKQQRHNQASN
jgi:hypothetical protein